MENTYHKTVAGGKNTLSILRCADDLLVKVLYDVLMFIDVTPSTMC